MTTIIATRKAIYADSQCSAYPGFKTTKLAYVRHDKSGGEYLVGGAGYLNELHFFVRLLQEYGLDRIWKLHLTEHWPPKIIKSADTDLLLVTREKKIFMFDKTLVPMPIDQDAYAIGSGGEYATAALDFGKTPTEAVTYACERDPYSKGPVHELKFPRRKNDASA